MARTKSSHRWMQEHFDDEYVKMAQKLGYRSRAVFKLKEIQKKDHILKPGMRIVDLGAAPGGWSQYARLVLGSQCQIIALDILDIEPIDGVDFIQGDFREQAVFDQLMAALAGTRVDLVLSDMAPNMSGSKEVDQPRSLYLSELALDMARAVLAKDGAFLVKLFQGEGFESYCKQVQLAFAKVLIRKPKASRPRSNEVYLLARGFK